MAVTKANLPSDSPGAHTEGWVRGVAGGSVTPHRVRQYSLRGRPGGSTSRWRLAGQDEAAEGGRREPTKDADRVRAGN